VTETLLLYLLATAFVLFSTLAGGLAAYKRGRVEPYKGKVKRVFGFSLGAALLLGLLVWGEFFPNSLDLNTATLLVSLTAFSLTYSWQRGQNKVGFHKF